MTPYPKRLIEVDLPIRRISAHARREKSIRHGHISTLHIWWARRPLAACRAVICAALWPDPADELCPQPFRDAVARLLPAFAEQVRRSDRLGNLCSTESRQRWMRTTEGSWRADHAASWYDMRAALLDFIADFANWDASTVPAYLETARGLTQAAHEALGGEPGTRPLVVDPFAGGGAIPLEALRVGADAFASDLNPVAVLLNKVVLEYIPKYGNAELRMMNAEGEEVVFHGLAEAVRYWGNWIKEQAERELAEFYPKDPDGATPIAYLWARTIRCEGPGCGAEVPLIKNCVLDAAQEEKQVFVRLNVDRAEKKINTDVVVGPKGEESIPTVNAWSTTCPVCGYTTPRQRVQSQLTQAKGGAKNSRLLAVVTAYPGRQGKGYRNPTEEDIAIIARAVIRIEGGSHGDILGSLSSDLPTREAHRAVGSQLPLYGFRHHRDLYSPRQQFALATIVEMVKRVPEPDTELGSTIHEVLAMCLAKQADYSTTLCRWRADGAFVNPTLGGEKKYVMVSDYAESCPMAFGSGNWLGQIDWVARFIEREASCMLDGGQAIQSSADSIVIPEDFASAFITDPPYYDSVPYSDLANFYYVWHRAVLLEEKPAGYLPFVTPKTQEMTVDHPSSLDERVRYRDGLTRAFEAGRVSTKPSGVGVIVFAHKSTEGWEALLEAIVQAGWCIVGSWPIDTELQNRLNALGTASLVSSIHLVCRPRENADGALQTNLIGDWREVLQELPARIHAWLPRLAREGIVGADAIFACLGPALEIFSRYSRVEKASGEVMTLSTYLEYVWAAVSKEALDMVFQGADTSGFEEDARLTAMWLWTLGTDGNGVDEGKVVASAGYTMEFDAARKIAQGLGAHLEQLGHLVEVKGSNARLLPAVERTRYLFGVESAKQPARRGKREAQMSLFEGMGKEQAEAAGWTVDDDLAIAPGRTVLDRVHQSMLLFAAGRSNALKRYLVDEGIGKDERFWSLAQALSALYPSHSDEKRWVDGVLARKKGLGF